MTVVPTYMQNAIAEKVDWFWRRYVSTYVNQPVTEPVPELWSVAGTRYLTQLYGEVRRLRILGHRGSEALERLFTQVYLLDAKEAFARYGV
ncbi:MAG: hypothetical protein BroJett015_41460 [Chloroflexota bacterium]|nr:MAG: hypothetical protein BroJett015_41460 [Chloroflexota bacterium]